MGVMRRERGVGIRGEWAHFETRYGARGQTHYQTHCLGTPPPDRPVRQLFLIDSRDACAPARRSPVCVVFSLAPFPRVTARGKKPNRQCPGLKGAIPHGLKPALILLRL